MPLTPSQSATARWQRLSPSERSEATSPARLAGAVKQITAHADQLTQLEIRQVAEALAAVTGGAA
jgi:hypothetical protein